MDLQIQNTTCNLQHCKVTICSDSVDNPCIHLFLYKPRLWMKIWVQMLLTRNRVAFLSYAPFHELQSVIT